VIAIFLKIFDIRRDRFYSSD